jgi:enolase
MSRIVLINAVEILDSRGIPTLQVWVHTHQQISGTAAVPSRATTKEFKPRETRDKDPKRYYGKGMKKAIEHIQGPILRACSLRPKTPVFLGQRVV